MEDLESAEDVETNMLSLFGSDYQDSGSEYCPSEADQNSASSLTNLEDVLQEGLQSSRLQEDRITGKPKKRIRKTENWARNVKKSKRNKGEEYFNYKGVTVPAKTPKMVALVDYLKIKVLRQLHLWIVEVIRYQQIKHPLIRLMKSKVSSTLFLHMSPIIHCINQ
uniref:SFRICE_037394 n=1 Tax=Spodoptera frugiperda TaxID=7108 RepID=A0A2H1X3V9_SPOFR